MDLLTKNLLPSPPDERDHIASINIVSTPESVDLKPWADEVENQFQFGSCTANAGVSALELMYKQKGVEVDLSRLYLYYWTRRLGGITADTGAYPRDIGKALKEYGTTYEINYPYTADNLNKEPPADIVSAAAKFKIESYERLYAIGGTLKLLQIKNALAQGIPVLINFEVFQGVFNLIGPWKNHSWNYVPSGTNPSQGWHEVLCIGYDDVSQRLLCENSWGPGWGDGGFFGIPYDMVDEPQFGEMWILNPNYNISVDDQPVPPPVEEPSWLSVNRAFVAVAIGMILMITKGFGLW
jgi:C1A family cysteine protease